MVEQGTGTSYIHISLPLMAVGQYCISARFELFPHQQGVQSGALEMYNKCVSCGSRGLQVNALKIQNPLYFTG